VAILSKVVEDQPKKTAIIYGSQKFTYKELDEFSSRFAFALIDLGVVKGDRERFFAK